MKLENGEVCRETPSLPYVTPGKQYMVFSTADQPSRLHCAGINLNSSIGC